jgi:hypothetical protein
MGGRPLPFFFSIDSHFLLMQCDPCHARQESADDRAPVRYKKIIIRPLSCYA